MMSEQSTGEIEEHAGSDGEHSGEVEHGELVEPVGDVASEVEVQTNSVTEPAKVMDKVAEWIERVVTAESAGDESGVEKVGAEVRDFAHAYPMPGLVE